MSETDKHQCQYVLVPVPFWGKARACQQSARWIVSYLTPDDGVNMRTRQREMRCKTHTESRFFPKGASGITTELIDDALPPRAPSTEHATAALLRSSPARDATGDEG